MADNNQVLREMIGTPMVWLYTPDGEILKYYDGENIVKYLVSFEYTYDELNDDVCRIELEFEKLRAFDLSYINVDIELAVEWGYILEYNKVLKTPRRKIAIRDIDSRFTDNGLSVILDCTDLVSYKKSLEIKTKEVWSNPSASQQVNSLQQIKTLQNKVYQNDLWGDHWGLNKTIHTDRYGAITLVDKIKTRRAINNSNFSDSIKVETLFTEQQINEAAAQSGDISSNSPRVNTLPTYNELYDSGLGVVAMATVINKISGNLGSDRRKLYTAMTDYLDNSFRDFGTSVVDTIDDIIHTKVRNMDQSPFKIFTYNGTTGELLNFKADTKLARTQVNKAKNVSVNPLSKKIEVNEVEVIDTEDRIQIPKFRTGNKTPEQMYEDWLRENPEPVARETYDEWYKKNQKINDELYGVGFSYKNKKQLSTDVKDYVSNNVTWDPSLEELQTNLSEHQRKVTNSIAQLYVDYDRYIGENFGSGVSFSDFINSKTDEEIKARSGIVKGDIARYTYVDWEGPHADYYNNLRDTSSALGPGVQTIFNILKGNNTSEIDSLIHNIVSSNKLTSVVTEKAVRRYKANAEIVGDPSIIKGKIYRFLNLNEKQNGDWYAVKVTHKIGKSGYLTELELWRRPKNVTVAMKTNAINPVFDEGNNKLTLEHSVEINALDLEFDNLKAENLDESVASNTIESLDKRLDILNGFYNTVNS